MKLCVNCIHYRNRIEHDGHGGILKEHYLCYRDKSQVSLVTGNPIYTKVRNCHDEREHNYNNPEDTCGHSGQYYKEKGAS